MTTPCSFCHNNIDSSLDRCPICKSKRVPWPHPAGAARASVSPQTTLFPKKERSTKSLLVAVGFSSAVVSAIVVALLLGGAREDKVAVPAPTAPPAAAPVTPAAIAPAAPPAPVTPAAPDPQKALEEWRAEAKAKAAAAAELASRPLTGPQVYEKARQSVLVLRTDCAQGSGFVIEGDLFVTNVHVIDGARSITLKTCDGRTATATDVVAVDAARDIAILKLPSTLQLPALELAKKPAIGDSVYALGAPAGLEFTLTSGLVSQIRDVPATRATLIQTDASISPGSSGGPLLNARGEVVGVNTLGSRAAMDVNNLNFAVSAADISIVLGKKQPSRLSGRTYRSSSLTEGLVSASDAERGGDGRSVRGGTAEDLADGSRRIKSLSGGISLVVPKDWYSLGMYDLSMCSQAEGAYDKYQERIVVVRFYVRENISLDEFYRTKYEIQGQICREMSKAVKSVSDTTVAGNAAKRVQYSNPKSGIIMNEYLIKRNESIYSILQTVYGADYGRWESKLKDMLESIRFEK